MVTSQDFVESPVLSGRGRLFRGPNELFFFLSSPLFNGQFWEDVPY